MLVREVIEVPLPPGETFAYVSDLTNAAEWDPGVEAVVALTPGAPRPGSRYEMTALFRGKRVPFAYELVELDTTGGRAVFDGRGRRATSRDTITVTAAASGSRITWEAEISMRGAFRVVEPFLAGTFKKLGAKALAGLRATLSAPR